MILWSNLTNSVTNRGVANRDVLSLLLPHTCRKGQEGLGFNKLSLVIEEVFRVELIWKFPLSLFIQHRGQKWDNECTLKNTKSKSMKTCHRNPKIVMNQFTIEISMHLTKSGASYFRNWIPHQLCVICGTVEDAEWNSIGYPLHLMDHSLGKARFPQGMWTATTTTKAQ